MRVGRAGRTDRYDIGLDPSSARAISGRHADVRSRSMEVHAISDELVEREARSLPERLTVRTGPAGHSLAGERQRDAGADAEVLAEPPRRGSTRTRR